MDKADSTAAAFVPTVSAPGPDPFGWRSPSTLTCAKVCRSQWALMPPLGRRGLAPRRQPTCFVLHGQGHGAGSRYPACGSWLIQCTASLGRTRHPGGSPRLEGALAHFACIAVRARRQCFGLVSGFKNARAQFSMNLSCERDRLRSRRGLVFARRGPARPWSVQRLGRQAVPKTSAWENVGHPSCPQTDSRGGATSP